MNKLADLELDTELRRILTEHCGHQSAIERWTLVSRIFGADAAHPRNDDNFADRRIRESVARLRGTGMLICDLGDGHGRYLATTADEYRAFRSRYGSAAFQVMETLRAMDQAANQKFPNSLQPALL